MAGIQRVTMNITASDDEVLTQLLTSRFSIVARGTHRHEPIESWKRLTTGRLDRNDVVNCDRGLDARRVLFETWFAERILSKLCPP
jgi:hypothetical protein